MEGGTINGIWFQLGAGGANASTFGMRLVNAEGLVFSGLTTRASNASAFFQVLTQYRVPRVTVIGGSIEGNLATQDDGIYSSRILKEVGMRISFRLAPGG